MFTWALDVCVCTSSPVRLLGVCWSREHEGGNGEGKEVHWHPRLPRVVHPGGEAGRRGPLVRSRCSCLHACTYIHACIHVLRTCWCKCPHTHYPCMYYQFIRTCNSVWTLQVVHIRTSAGPFRVRTVCDFLMLTFRFYRTNGTTFFKTVEAYIHYRSSAER